MSPHHIFPPKKILFHHTQRLNYNALECVENFTQNLLQKRLKERGQRLCWIPQADYFKKLMNRPGMEACQVSECCKKIVAIDVVAK
jgi:hypothetical protein